MFLEELLKRQEGKTLEFKRDLSSPDRVIRTITAFANAAGGTVLFGVEDGSRIIVGIKDPMALEERLASIISDAIAPLLVPHIEVIAWRNTNVVAVEVHPVPYPPCYVKKLGLENGVFVRVGSTNRKADAPLIEQLKREAGHIGFDEQPMILANSEEIDFRAASEFFRPFRNINKNDLQTLKLLVRYQHSIVPTIGAILLFGTKRIDHFPDAWIQCGRFNGIDKSEIVDSAEFLDYPVAAIEKVLDFIKKHSMHAITINNQARHAEKWTIPLTTAREALINAIVHADYSQRGMPIRLSIFNDRMEIENPGLLPSGLTIEDILKGVSKIRNRVIARVFKELRLIEQWGSGIQRMLADCRTAGLPDPIFEEIATHFRVTISLMKKRPQELDKIDDRIYGLLQKSSGMTTASLAMKIGLSTRAVRARLNEMVSKGVLLAIGTSPKDPKRKYVISD
jgi:ATP-dependent DNA helicase RecG